VLGGVVLVVLDKLPLKERFDDAMHFPLGMSLKIGFIQCLAMVPGVSRSGATIVGAMMLGASKRAAAEFSFFLSMPTMGGAFAYDLYKNRDILSAADLHIIAVGFVFAFIAAVFVVRGLLAFVSKHGYAVFGWWRIIIGTAVLLAIAAGY
jgi:undecaprenyl-diphosphatase